MAVHIDALRVAQDPNYAASLTPDDWAQLAHNPDWARLVAEQPETVASALAQAQPPTAQPLPPTPAAVLNGPYTIIGNKVPRLQGMGIINGFAQYTEHMNFPGALYTRTLRSPHPHAKITSIDTSDADKFPGVISILHRGNLPDMYKDVVVGSGPPPRGLFDEELFEVGAPVAMIAAESEHIADEAMRLIQVQYEVLPAAMDFLEAMKSTTPKQFDSNLDGTILGVSPPLVRGDPTQKGDVSIDAVLTKAFEQHVALELTNSVSYWDNDRLIQYYTSQWAHGVRANLSQALKVPQNKVRAIQPGYVGSGYGYRSNADLSEIHAAILAKITGRPVRNTYTRAEDFVTRTHRPQFRNEMHMSVNKDGNIVSGQFKVIANVGAARSAAANGSWFVMQDLYKIPNLQLDAVDVFTNSYKQGPYRCVSHPNGTFAMDVMMEKAAYAIGMDPVQFRLMNLNEVGNPDTKKPFSNPGIRDCIQQAADAIGWQQNWHAPKAKEVSPGVFHGMGLAAHACSHGAGGNPATGQVIVNTDGTVQCISAANDIGDGQRSLMTMIAAESLGVPLYATSITLAVDTDVTTDASGTFGSQQTNTGGRGMYEAGQDARKQVLDWGAKRFVDDARKAGQTINVTADDVDLQNGVVSMKSDSSKTLTLSQVVQFAGNPILGRSIYTQDPQWERTAFASHAAEVEVDTVTGTVTVLRYVAAHDVGRALNPFTLEQQIEGGVVMALGATLTEELLSDQATGLPLNPNMLDYKPLTIKDAPRDIKVVLVEHPKEYGVFGAHGIGEPPMASPAPTITNAVYNAIGVWIQDMPITREKVLAALKGAS
ncbi:MAG: xanthine dehydrogenase family protein molybdopterin-binding subunit [Chloroflexi bacterium]|nr:xanthine dehydrogenase family protein molybdopterin-binding subunit [Chloroflexota bacterium]